MNKKQWVGLLKIAVSAAALYLVFQRLDTAALANSLRTLRWQWVLPAIALFLLSQYLSAIRLNVMLRRMGVHLSQAANFRLYLLGMYYNIFLPGGIGGDGYKVYLLHRTFGSSTKKLVKALLLDRLFGLLALLLCLLLLVKPHLKDLPLELPPVIVLAAIAGSIVLGYVILHYGFPTWQKDAMEVTAWSLCVQLAQLICALMLLQGIGAGTNLSAYLSLFLISSVAAVIPFTLGGAGARELAFLYGAPLLQLDPIQAVTLSLLFYSITLLVSLTGSIFSFKKLRLQ